MCLVEVAFAENMTCSDDDCNDYSKVPLKNGWALYGEL